MLESRVTITTTFDKNNTAIMTLLIILLTSAIRCNADYIETKAEDYMVYRPTSLIVSGEVTPWGVYHGTEHAGWKNSLSIDDYLEKNFYGKRVIVSIMEE